MAASAAPPTTTVSPPPSTLRTNLSYLIRGPASPYAPSSLKARSTLRTVRYVLKFVFWRLLRYLFVPSPPLSLSRARKVGGQGADVTRRTWNLSKYAALAAGTAALAGTALGTSLPWIAAIAIPSVPVAAAIGLTTAVIKVPCLAPSPSFDSPKCAKSTTNNNKQFSWKHRGNHFRQGWIAGGEGRDPREDEQKDADEAEAAFDEVGTPVGVHPRAGRAWEKESFL